MSEMLTGPGVREAISSPALQRLYDYWDARRRDGRLPCRADVDPIEIPFVLGNVLLVEVLRSPMRFRIRLHGTHLVQRAGYDLTGRMTEELPNTEFRTLARKSFTQVAAEGTPLLSKRDRELAGKSYRYESLMLPLANDGAEVDMLLIGLIYLDR